MNDTTNGGTWQIQIYEQPFTIQTPYQEGHTINRAEAKVLNQYRMDNVVRNFRRKIKQALHDPEALDTVREQFAHYDTHYYFEKPTRQSRAGQSPYAKEARAIARAAIQAELRESGINIKTINRDKLAAAIETAAQKDDVIALAKQRIAEREQAAPVRVGVADLGLVSNSP